MTLFFGAVAFIILASRVAALVGNAPPWLTTVEIAVLMALPYVLLRLVDDFTHVRSAIKRGAELGLAAGVIATYATAPALPTPVILYVVLYFFGVSIYCAFAFIRAARSLYRCLQNVICRGQRSLRTVPAINRLNKK